MIQKELKQLIDKYCMGIEPTDAQMDEIFDLVGEMGADPQEVAEYMQKMQNGPTREEVEAKKKAEFEAKKKAEQEAKEKAELEAKKKAQRQAKRKAEQEAKEIAEREARRRAQQEADRKKREWEEKWQSWKRTGLNILCGLVIGCVSLFGIVYFFDQVRRGVYFSSHLSSIQKRIAAKDYKLIEKLDLPDSIYVFRESGSSGVGLCDSNAVVLVPPEYDNFAVFKISDSVRVVQPCGLDSYTELKTCDEIIFPMVYQESGDKYGIIDLKTFKLIAPCIYDLVYPTSLGQIHVEIDGKTGYLNMDGSVAKEPE